MPIGKWDEKSEEHLQFLRRKLDQKDMALLHLLSDRVKLAKEIGLLKEELDCHDDIKRVRDIFSQLEKQCEALELDRGKIRELWKGIMRLPWD